MSGPALAAAAVDACGAAAAVSGAPRGRLETRSHNSQEGAWNGAESGPAPSFVGPFCPMPTNRAERRRVRLQRGIRSWAADVVAQGGPEKGVALLTLTFREDVTDEHAARAISTFWQRYRMRWGRRLRFDWIELTERGRIHVHALVVDAPGIDRGHTKRTLEKL